MTDERAHEIWNSGWDGYFAHKTISDVPDYPTAEERDEWISGWLTAQSSETLPQESCSDPLTNVPDEL